jgi:hypothetical protein
MALACMTALDLSVWGRLPCVLVATVEGIPLLRKVIFQLNLETHPNVCQTIAERKKTS